jgi:hypothetical protein
VVLKVEWAEESWMVVGWSKALERKSEECKTPDFERWSPLFESAAEGIEKEGIVGPDEVSLSPTKRHATRTDLWSMRLEGW